MFFDTDEDILLTTRNLLLGIMASAIVLIFPARVFNTMMPVSLEARPEEKVVSCIILPDAKKTRITKEPTRAQLIKAIIQVESSGRARARGRAGERGLCQIKYDCWTFTTRRLLRRRWSWSSAYNRKRNIAVGSAYFDYCMRRFRGDWKLACMAYNDGPERVKQGRTRRKAWRYLWKIKRELRKMGVRIK